jgi:biopolymer transport protein ExbB/TolQ
MMRAAKQEAMDQLNAAKTRQDEAKHQEERKEAARLARQAAEEDQRRRAEVSSALTGCVRACAPY